MWRRLSAEEKNYYSTLAKSAVVDLSPRHKLVPPLQTLPDSNETTVLHKELPPRQLAVAAPIVPQERLGSGTGITTQNLIRVYLPLLPFEQESSWPP
jgi:hypothetical protein